MINALNAPMAENMAAATGVMNAQAGDPQKEALARQHGYPSYEAMIQFMRNREIQTQGGGAPVQARPSAPPAAPVDNRSAFQRLLDGLQGRG
jgi:hypothetical protein